MQGLLPSSEAVNPALTVIANTLRVGDHLLGRVNSKVIPVTLCPAAQRLGKPNLVRSRIVIAFDTSTNFGSSPVNLLTFSVNPLKKDPHLPPSRSESLSSLEHSS